MRISTLLLAIIVSMNAFAQTKTNINVPYTKVAPQIDGVEDEAWKQVSAVTIASDFQSEQPTVSAYWKALWDSTALYVLIKVQDDDHWPGWASQGNWWEYDQIEVYLDINSTLEDGRGPNDKGTGHYQAVPQFLDGADGVPQTLEVSNYRPGGTTCYKLDGENYVFELALDYSSFVDENGFTMSVVDFASLAGIGFDVTIVDQDEGATTSRHRRVWHNTGATDENYINMDDAGTIKFSEALPDEPELSNTLNLDFNIYPNPANDFLQIDLSPVKAGSLQMELLNINGQLVKSSLVDAPKRAFRMDVSDLSAGVYFLNVKGAGIAKVEKLVVR